LKNFLDERASDPVCILIGVDGRYRCTWDFASCMMGRRQPAGRSCVSDRAHNRTEGSFGGYTTFRTLQSFLAIFHHDGIFTRWIFLHEIILLSVFCSMSFGVFNVVERVEKRNFSKLNKAQVSFLTFGVVGFFFAF
jgi:hypothetical protein